VGDGVPTWLSEAPIERAFTVFTERFGDFKPPEHNMLGAPIAETVFEPRAGGNIVDRAMDGSECRWARILAFDPPEQVVFSWDISPRWTIETDQAQTSEVEVRFYAESSTRTRVELEHRHIDRHGPGWEAITIEMVLACPPEYRAAPGRAVYVIHAGDRAVMVGEEDLTGSMAELVTTMLTAGDPA